MRLKCTRAYKERESTKKTAAAIRMVRGRFLSHDDSLFRACSFSSLLFCLTSQLFFSLTRERNFGKAESQANQDNQSTPTPRAMNITNAQLPNQKPREIKGILATSRVRANTPMKIRLNTELSPSEGSELDSRLSSEPTS